MSNSHNNSAGGGGQLPPGMIGISGQISGVGIAATGHSISSGKISLGQTVAGNATHPSLIEIERREANIKEWMKIKEILDSHQIIEDWPDGDIVIRIKRARAERIKATTGLPPEPSDYQVEFGADSAE